jgi:hypothetical protein
VRQLARRLSRHAASASSPSSALLPDLWVVIARYACPARSVWTLTGKYYREALSRSGFSPDTGWVDGDRLDALFNHPGAMLLVPGGGSRNALRSEEESPADMPLSRNNSQQLSHTHMHSHALAHGDFGIAGISVSPPISREPTGQSSVTTTMMGGGGSAAADTKTPMEAAVPLAMGFATADRSDTDMGSGMGVRFDAFDSKAVLEDRQREREHSARARAMLREWSRAPALPRVGWDWPYDRLLVMDGGSGGLLRQIDLHFATVTTLAGGGRGTEPGVPLEQRRPYGGFMDGAALGEAVFGHQHDSSLGAMAVDEAEPDRRSVYIADPRKRQPHTHTHARTPASDASATQPLQSLSLTCALCCAVL